MTPVLAAADSSAGPWWAAPGSALLGIIVGFALKAVFDAAMERRRVKREDRLRFVAEKMRGYADLGMLCSEAIRLMREMEDYEQRYAAAEQQLQRLIARYNEGSDISQELENLREDVDAIKAHRDELKAQSAGKLQDLSRISNLLALLAPAQVQDAAHELVVALTDEPFDEASYDRAHATFVLLAGEDLGRAS